MATFNEELDGLLNNFEAGQEAKKQQLETKESQESRYVTEFSNFAQITARPFLEQVGNQLRGRGHDFKIEWQSEEPHKRDGSFGGGRPARIALRIYPKGKESAGPDVLPAFALIGSKEERKVRINVNTTMPGKGGFTGDQGKYSIEQLTPQTMQTEMLKFLKQVF